MKLNYLAAIIEKNGGRFRRAEFLLAGILIAPAVTASDGSMGQKLHTENCMKCHDTSVYTRENRIVHSYRELKERIRQCELSNDLAWFDEEVEAVANYLNENFYHFAK